MKVCALTNVYNEAFNLPIWLRHYGTQVGAEHCIIIDDGSTDCSTSSVGQASVIRLPKQKFNDHVRARLVSGVANSLLEVYDAVIYSDCDEMLVADPRKYTSLVDYVAQMPSDAVTAIGLNLTHNLTSEDPIDPSKPILAQRGFAHFVSPMCKTLITRKPIRWRGGFHHSTAPVNFHELYLVHLRWLDLGECLKRLSITRRVAFDGADHVSHHHADYLKYVKMFQGAASQEISDDFDLTRYTRKLSADTTVTDEGFHVPAAYVVSEKLLRLPPWLRCAF